jgi:hypothetical protein
MLQRTFGFWIGLALPALGMAETPQDFSGQWVAAGTEQAAADNKQAAMPDSHRGGLGGGRGTSGGGMGGMGGGHGAMGNGGRHRSGDPASNAASGPTALDVTGDSRVHAKALAIRQSDVVFDVAADGKRTVYRFDNRNNYGPAYGGTVTLTWAAPEMVIETHPDTGGSVEEHYTLSDDGKKLSLRVHEQRPCADSGRDVTRVFVRNGTPDAAKLP